MAGGPPLGDRRRTDRGEAGLHHRLVPAVEPGRRITSGTEGGDAERLGALLAGRVLGLAAFDRLSDFRRRPDLAAGAEAHHRRRPVGVICRDRAGDPVAEGMADQDGLAAAGGIECGHHVGSEVAERQALHRAGAFADATGLGQDCLEAGRGDAPRQRYHVVRSAAEAGHHHDRRPAAEHERPEPRPAVGGADNLEVLHVNPFRSCRCSRRRGCRSSARRSRSSARGMAA